MMKKYLLILPLILATSAVYAAWKSNSADSEETPMNNVTANDEDRSAFIDLIYRWLRQVILMGAQSQVIEAATDQGVGFTQSFLEKYFPTVEISFETKEGHETDYWDFSGGTTL